MPRLSFYLLAPSSRYAVISSLEVLASSDEEAGTMEPDGPILKDSVRSMTSVSCGLRVSPHDGARPNRIEFVWMVMGLEDLGGQRDVSN